MSDPPTVDTNRRRPTVWDHVGGTSGLVQSAMPSLAFVSAHAVAGIGTAIAVAIATATVVLVVRLLRRQTVRPALGGMVGVVVSSAIAYRTGDARDFFLPDIWGYAIAAVVTALSIVVRRPLAGILWSALNGDSMGWQRNRRAMVGYSVATGVAALAFTVRTVAQMWFYEHDQPGTMVAMRLALNYPLWAIVALAWAWSIRRAGGTS
ncbi:DUF3159 domain-containing protein [Tsukamurella tyrosinosolvens]|uniref:DUF3159 domain-containing protein n=1 Tax=Tsukamurella tyrosinosolvens TaxID=57704 RepID=UPI0008382210|nr:DUF3159 domain-containing protein [Tsukamurella tyrosinosolvens]